MQCYLKRIETVIPYMKAVTGKNPNAFTNADGLDAECNKGKLWIRIHLGKTIFILTLGVQAYWRQTCVQSVLDLRPMANANKWSCSRGNVREIIGRCNNNSGHSLQTEAQFLSAGCMPIISSQMDITRWGFLRGGWPTRMLWKTRNLRYHVEEFAKLWARAQSISLDIHV